jgi:hypothetical protein
MTKLQVNTPYIKHKSLSTFPAMAKERWGNGISAFSIYNNVSSYFNRFS